MTFSVTQNGKALDPSLYTWDEYANTFLTKEDNLVLDFYDFSSYDGCTFNTGINCTFKTGASCTFNTGSNCTFDTSSSCTFNTGSSCTFDTGFGCTFKTGACCVFSTGGCCTFTTGHHCVIVRHDIFETIELQENRSIILNNNEIKGYTIIPETKTITIDGKDIEISVEAFNKLKKQLSS